MGNKIIVCTGKYEKETENMYESLCNVEKEVILTLQDIESLYTFKKFNNKMFSEIEHIIVPLIDTIPKNIKQLTKKTTPKNASEAVRIQKEYTEKIFKLHEDIDDFNMLISNMENEIKAFNPYLLNK